MQDKNKKRENHKKYMRNVWYPLNKKKHIAMVLISKRKRALSIRDVVNNYKSKIGCIDCKIKDFRVLDFDHIGKEKKRDNIATLISRGFGIKVIMEEIKKCKIRCSNCHRIKTILRRVHTPASKKYKRSK